MRHTEEDMMMTNPDLALALFKVRHSDLQKDAETARLLKEARTHRPQSRGRFLASIGGILVAFGLWSTRRAAA